MMHSVSADHYFEELAPPSRLRTVSQVTDSRMEVVVKEVAESGASGSPRPLS